MADGSSNHNSYEEQQRQEKEAMKKMEEETRLWMETNEKVKAYLNQFSTFWAEDFIKGYPRIKSRFVRYGDSLGDLPEQRQIAYLDKSYDRLMDIQLKKIFDVMCQWDANLVKVDDIVCSWEFAEWQDDPTDCPFITEITEEEVDLYLRYIDSADFDKNPHISFIDYDSYRTEDEEYEKIPEWFLFENAHTGNNRYLSLPMLRTTKEDFYRSLWRKEENEKREKQYESGELERYVADERPEISVHKYSHVETFITLFESKEILNAFRKHYDYFTGQLIRDDPEQQRDSWLTERVNDIIHNLAGVKETIPIEANSDWRVALINAYEAYEKKKIKEVIPYAYSDYLMRKELKINSSTAGNKNFNKDLAESVKNQILRGRELNGELRDFGF